MGFALKPVPYESLEGWMEDDPSGLFAPMARCLQHMQSVKPYKTGSLGLTSEALQAVYLKASMVRHDTPEDARSFFEQHFQPFRIIADEGRAGQVTAFYEPEVAVSASQSDVWKYPFYRRPPDLVNLDDQTRPAGWDSAIMFAQQTDEGLAPYPDRRAIDQGRLEGLGLEIAWAKSRVDVFFAHIQGAARLRFGDGTVKRVTYAAKAGHPFTGIGRVLIDMGEIDPKTVSMGTIRAWLAKHPDRESEILWKNRSYIFFRESQVDDDRLGPIAAAKVALEPMRSIAVDRLIHTFSSLFFIRSRDMTHLTDGKPFARLMIALDTGTAIVGPARADIFTGSGDVAGDLAGGINSSAEFTLLIPKAVASEFL